MAAPAIEDAEEPQGLEAARRIVWEYTRQVVERPLLRLLTGFNRMDMVRFPLGTNIGSLLLIDAALAFDLLLPAGMLGSAAAKAGFSARFSMPVVPGQTAMDMARQAFKARLQRELELDVKRLEAAVAEDGMALSGVWWIFKLARCE